MTKTRDVDPSQGLEQYIGRMVQDARLRRQQEAKEKGDFKDAPWSQAFVAKRTYTSQSRISEVETGEVPPDTDLAQKLEGTLGLDPRFPRQPGSHPEPGERQRLRQALHPSPPPRGNDALRLRPDSPWPSPDTRVRPSLVLAGQAGDPPRRIQHIVDQRMERARRVLSGDHQPWLTAIIYEAVLHCDMGEPEVAREQLEHLLKAQEQPNISVRVLPFTAAIVSGSFTLLTLNSGRRATYTEGFGTGSYSEETATVMQYQRVYDRLAEEALSARDSTGRIHEVLKRFK